MRVELSLGLKVEGFFPCQLVLARGTRGVSSVWRGCIWVVVGLQEMLPLKLSF